MKANRYIMKMIAGLLCMVMLLVSASCKTHKDCRGRKKTAKTQMGGWL